MVFKSYWILSTKQEKYYIIMLFNKIIVRVNGISYFFFIDIQLYRIFFIVWVKTLKNIKNREKFKEIIMND